MNDWNGKWSVIYNADGETGRHATRVIEGFNLQTWPNRELVIANSSDMDFGGYGYTEVPGGRSEALAKATGEYCLNVIDWNCLQHPNLLFVLSQHVNPRHRLNVMRGGFLVATGFFRRAGHLAFQKQTPLVDVEVDVGGVVGNKLTNHVAEPPDTSGINPEDVNLLCPAGIGDILWIVYKFMSVAETMRKKGHRTVFWLPGNEQRRSGGLLRTFGLNYGYLDSLTTPWVWSTPGDPPVDGPGIYTIHANRHLENGKHIDGWYPAIKGKYPEITPVLQRQMTSKRYVTVFMCMNAYMGGQLKPQTWAEIIAETERTVAPVCLVGAGKDVAFAKEVEGFYRPGMAPMYDQPVEEVIDSVNGGLASLGVASGLMIVSAVYGPRTLMAYPQHLMNMPGTWESSPENCEWCLVGDLRQKSFDWIKTL